MSTQRYLLGALTIVSVGLVIVLGGGGQAGSAPLSSNKGRVLTGILVESGRVWVTGGDGTVARIDPRSGRILRPRLRLGGFVWKPASGMSSVWVGVESGVLLRIDAKTGRVKARIAREWLPSQVATAAGSVWVYDAGSISVRHDRPEIVRLDPSSNRVVAVIRRPLRIAAGDRLSLWVFRRPATGARILQRLSPSSNRLSGPRITLGWCAHGVAVTGGTVWVADCAGATVNGTLRSFSAETGRQTGRPVPVGTEPLALAAGFGSIWVASHAGVRGMVSRVDPRSRRVIATIDVGLPQSALAVGAGAVWTVTGRVVTRIDPTANRVRGRIVVGL